MKRITSLAAVLLAMAIWPLAQVAQAGPAAPDVPDDIAVTDGSKVFLVGHAVGLQIYSCNGTTWGPATPRADLYDDTGKVIATHFGGPTWQARDGSKVVGERVNGVQMGSGAIPWLLLRAASTSAGPDGSRLGATKHIQRVNTIGGVAPMASTCNAGTAGAVAEIPYTADYYFWK
jgi:hypothetical protein